MFVLFGKKRPGVFSDSTLQAFYDSCLERFMDSKAFVCPFCGGKLHLYGRVRRSIHLDWQTMTIEIQRVRCAQCKKTHRILLECFIPYHLFCAQDARDAISCHKERDPFRENDFDPEVSQTSLRRFAQRYGEMILFDSSGKIKSFDFLERRNRMKIIIVDLEEKY